MREYRVSTQVIYVSESARKGIKEIRERYGITGRELVDRAFDGQYLEAAAQDVVRLRNEIDRKMKEPGEVPVSP